MFKNMILVAGAALALAATPAAAADFTGPRVGANLGIAGENFLSDKGTTYGLNAGYDTKLAGAIVGATVEFQDGFDKNTPRDLAVSVRAGFQPTAASLLYATVGYTNLRLRGEENGGVRVGVGGELAVSKNIALTVEQRYADYGHGDNGFQTVAGVNVRF